MLVFFFLKKDDVVVFTKWLPPIGMWTVASEKLQA